MVLWTVTAVNLQIYNDKKNYNFIWAQRLVSLPFFMVAERYSDIHGNNNGGYGIDEEPGEPRGMGRRT